MSAAPALSTVELDANVVGIPPLHFAYVAAIQHGDEIRGHIFTLRTDHRNLEVYVSRTGRSLRVWDHDNGTELK